MLLCVVEMVGLKLVEWDVNAQIISCVAQRTERANVNRGQRHWFESNQAHKSIDFRVWIIPR